MTPGSRLQGGGVGEGLEALEGERLQEHGERRPYPSPSPGPRSLTLAYAGRHVRLEAGGKPWPAGRLRPNHTRSRRTSRPWICSQDLEARELDVLANVARDYHFAPGEVVVAEGDQSGRFHLVVRGQASASVGDQVVAQFGPGHYFGEMAMIDRQPRSATVTADEELDTLSLASISVRPLLREHPRHRAQDAREALRPPPGHRCQAPLTPAPSTAGGRRRRGGSRPGSSGARPLRRTRSRAPAAPVDGKGPSIWDTFCRLPGRVAGGATGDIAIDHLHHHQADFALIADMGYDAYRFSISWPRVLPDGKGAPNPRGLGLYDQLVDEMLDVGLTPYATLYHWDLPQVLQDAGGWAGREVTERFADYAGLVAARLGDRVTHWATLNEPWCSAYLGYHVGVHARDARTCARRSALPTTSSSPTASAPRRSGLRARTAGSAWSSTWPRSSGATVSAPTRFAEWTGCATAGSSMPC